MARVLSLSTCALLLACAFTTAAASRALTAKNVFGSTSENISKTLGVSYVQYYSGVYEIISRDGEWRHESRSGEVSYWQEVERDEWRVHLKGADGTTAELDLRRKGIKFYDAQGNYKYYQPILSGCESEYCWEDNCQCYPWYQAPSGYEGTAPKLSGATWARGGK